MGESGSVIELRSGRALVAERQLRAAVKLVMASAEEADGPELGALLVLIREAGIDPLEAAFATGVRRFRQIRRVCGRWRVERDRLAQMEMQAIRWRRG